jgi:hypothetical protein
MTPLAVVEDFDVFEDRGSSLAPCGEPGAVHELGLERLPIQLRQLGQLGVDGVEFW